jgi:hypothetical protein
MGAQRLGQRDGMGVQGQRDSMGVQMLQQQREPFTSHQPRYGTMACRSQQTYNPCTDVSVCPDGALSTAATRAVQTDGDSNLDSEAGSAVDSSLSLSFPPPPLSPSHPVDA